MCGASVSEGSECLGELEGKLCLAVLLVHNQTQSDAHCPVITRWVLTAQCFHATSVCVFQISNILSVYEQVSVQEVHQVFPSRSTGKH